MRSKTPQKRSVPSEQGRLLMMILVAGAAVYAIFIGRTAFRAHGVLRWTLVDDAMVSMRYAQHLAQGYGLVWNPGQAPVEGFTNPGWTLWMAALHLLGMPKATISLAVMASSALVLLALAWCAHEICRTIGPESRYAPAIAAGITALYYPLIFWSLRGMEVGLLSLLMGLSLLSALRWGGNRVLAFAAAGCFAALAVVVRLDAALQASIVAGYAAWIGRRHLPAALIPAVATILAVLAVLTLQRSYFGDYLPNTYYLKISGASLFVRLKYGLVAFYQHAGTDTLFPVALCLTTLLLYKDLRKPTTAVLGMLFLAQCAYSIWVGGDYAEPEVDAANRFIAQGMPFLFILVGLCCDRLFSDLSILRNRGRSPAPGVTSTATAVLVLLVISGKSWANWTVDNAALLKADIRRVRAGLAIADQTAAQAVIAVHAAGQIPYYSDRHTIDLLGLNDPVIARGPLSGPFYPGHDKWNYEYSIDQLRPDLVADNWIRLGDFMRSDPDYQQLENGMYVRIGSTLVDVPGLSAAYP
jgi:arabinofuranosyltransferase